MIDLLQQYVHLNEPFLAHKLPHDARYSLRTIPVIKGILDPLIMISNVSPKTTQRTKFGSAQRYTLPSFILRDTKLCLQ